jgi:hypothetical protein
MINESRPAIVVATGSLWGTSASGRRSGNGSSVAYPKSIRYTTTSIAANAPATVSTMSGIDEDPRAAPPEALHQDQETSDRNATRQRRSTTSAADGSAETDHLMD